MNTDSKLIFESYVKKINEATTDLQNKISIDDFKPLIPSINEAYRSQVKLLNDLQGLTFITQQESAELLNYSTNTLANLVSEIFKIIEFGDVSIFDQTKNMLDKSLVQNLKYTAPQQKSTQQTQPLPAPTSAPASTVNTRAPAPNTISPRQGA